MRNLLSIAVCAAVSWATMVACGAPLESLRLDLESGLSGADHWAGRRRHPAVVNGVCDTARPDLISLRGQWDFVTQKHSSGNRMCGFRWPSFWAKARPIAVPSNWEAQGVGEEGSGNCHAHPDASPKPIRHYFVGEGGRGFFRYLMEEPLPNGAKVVRISGLDVLSDLPEGAALLDSVVDYLAKQKENR